MVKQGLMDSFVTEEPPGPSFLCLPSTLFSFLPLQSVALIVALVYDRKIQLTRMARKGLVMA